ncbi:MAG: diguanylate cyclase (GGDEF)-like protein [Candidatus Paceibacteria bacterium]|jgi:diguanylate cyclase (GGDEF)-like protein
MTLSALPIPPPRFAQSLSEMDHARTPSLVQGAALSLLSQPCMSDVIALALAVTGAAAAQLHLQQDDAPPETPPALILIATELLLDADGQPTGHLTIFDHAPRQLSASQQENLAALVRQVCQQITSQRAVLRLEASLQRLEVISSTDALTGLQNRRSFEQHIGQEFARARRYALALSFLMLDVDFFKHFNDLHGHQAGDRMLYQIAQTLRQKLRGQDTLARFGGEEFVVVLPNTGRDGAMVLAERYRLAIESLGVAEVTVSIGVATRDITMQGPDDLINAADRALYLAKGSGRNKVIEAPLN